MRGARVLTALLMLLAAIPAAADDPTPATIDFIVRAPATEIDGIASRMGLTVVDEVETTPDAQGRTVYMVRAPSGADPLAIIDDVETLEPEAVGIERVFLATITDPATAVGTDQSFTGIVESITAAVRVTPPSGTIDSDWIGGSSARLFEPGETRTVEVTFENGVDTDPASYGFAVIFDSGATASDGGNGGACAAGGHENFEISGKQVDWWISNAAAAPLTLDSLDLDWAAVNGDLLKVKLDGAEIYTQATAGPSALIAGGWHQDAARRAIDAGASMELRLEFAADADLDPANYALSAAFAEGGTLAPGDCAVTGHSDITPSGDRVEWSLTNGGAAALSFDSVTVNWPSANGEILEIKLDGDKVFERGAISLEHGENADGSKRFVWEAYVNQSGATLLQVDEANKDHRGDAVVAIIDTGVDPNHELLAGSLVPGYDFILDLPGSGSETADLDQSTMVILDQSTMVILDEDQVVPLNQSTMVILDDDQDSQLDVNNVPPAFGHGTMVAGIIHRVAPEADLMPLRVFDGNGNGNLFDIVRAIYYAVDNGANVINMSFSMKEYSPELMRAINYAARKGVTCVASAGNEGEETIVFPAALGNTIGVAATRSDDTLGEFSNFGSDLVTVAAPGVNIVTTYPGGGWAVASGTSFAAPWISGATALFVDKNSKKGRRGRADYYLTTEALAEGQPVQGTGSGKVGYGRADLNDAMGQLRNRLLEEAPPAGVYSIVVAFEEGCSVEYPPLASGPGCSVDPANQLLFDDSDRVEWDVTNLGSGPATIASVSIAWPSGNGELRKIKMGGDLFDGNRAGPSALVDWTDPEGVTPDSETDPEDREIAAGETRRLRFEFELDALRSIN